MALLSGIRNLITRRKPPLAIDIAEPRPDGAVEEETDVTEPVEVAEAVDGIEPVALAVEPEPEFEPDPSPHTGSVLEQQGVDVAAVVESIGDRINDQSDRIETQCDRQPRRRLPDVAYPHCRLRRQHREHWTRRQP